MSPGGGRFTAGVLAAAALATGAAGCGSGTGSISPSAITGIRTNPAGNGLVVSYIGGSCDHSARLAIIEKSDRIDFKVVVTSSGGSCDAAGHPRTVSGPLAGAVGHREIWSESERFQAFDGSRLRSPTQLPAGFTLGSEAGTLDQPEPPGIGITSGAATTTPRPVYTTISWMRHYGQPEPTNDPAACPVGRGVLEVTIAGANLTADRSSVVLGTRRVGDATAQLSSETNGLSLTWPVAGGAIRVRSSGACSGDRILNEAELLAVARSVQPDR